MNEQEKYRAKIEARMKHFNETIEEITTKAKLRKVVQPEIDVDGILEKHANAQAMLDDLEKSDKISWLKFQKELDGLIDDIDTDLRKAMVYFG